MTVILIHKNMAINDYSFLSTTISSAYAQTGGSAVSGTYFSFTITPTGGNPEDPAVIAADDFKIGNAAENPPASNIWWGGNVDSTVQKVEFVDTGTPYAISNTVEARIYLFSGTTMPNSDLTILVDVDYTAPTFGDEDDRASAVGRPFCIRLYTPSSTNVCDGSGGTNTAYTGISTSAINTSYTVSSVNAEGTGANPYCSEGFHEYKISGTVPEGQTTTIFGQSFVADTGYYFPDPGITANLTVNTQGLDFSDAYTLHHIITRNADNQITTYRFEVNYTPPDPSIEDLTGTDSANITKFASLRHEMIYSNYTPVQITSSNSGTEQTLQAVTLDGQTGVGTATDGNAGPTPLDADGETRSIYVYGSDFAGYYLTVKQVVGGTTKTLAFAEPHPGQGKEASNTFTASSTNSGVVQLNIQNTKGGKATFYPSGRPYAVDYARENENSKEGYRVPVAYHEYKVHFPPCSAVTYYDIYVTKSDDNESGNSDATKENVTTGYGISGAGSGATATYPIRVYQYDDPEISIAPTTNAASSYDTMPSAATKTTIRANTKLVDGKSTGTTTSAGYIALSFAIGAASDKTLSLSRQPIASDFSVISGGNGLSIFYESLAAAVVGSGDNNTVNVTGAAYIETAPVDDTVINLLTQNFITAE
tara:strand:+ start:1229 stop:3175 length:1947 start_codon:yes stop_codon:yes gene_type:complete